MGDVHVALRCQLYYPHCVWQITDQSLLDQSGSCLVGGSVISCWGTNRDHVTLGPSQPSFPGGEPMELEEKGPRAHPSTPGFSQIWREPPWTSHFWATMNSFVWVAFLSFVTKSLQQPSCLRHCATLSLHVLSFWKLTALWDEPHYTHFIESTGRMKEVKLDTATQLWNGRAGFTCVGPLIPQGSIFLRIFPIPQHIGLGKGEERGEREEGGGTGRERGREIE